MNDQLTAPTRISKEVNRQSAENALPPAGFAAAAADGLDNSGANASVFSQHPQRVVQATSSKPIEVSAGVAMGMLIQKTTPNYPPIAKTVHVSGMVQLKVIVSKAGTIRDLRVVSGPALLQQSAVEAVRTWRYRPYLMNNEPTEMETTINVVFSFGG
jgi:periplasmic protein TonB